MTLRGLLVDYGGVLTTDVFASFDAFCAREGLPPGTVRDLFRDDPAARSLLGATTADVAMLDFVRAARTRGIRTGLISNSWGSQRYDRILLDELFDGIVISGDVGVRKPDPAIYVLGAGRFQVARQVVDVDALLRREADRGGTQHVDRRVRLAHADVAGDHDAVEQLVQ